MKNKSFLSWLVNLFYLFDPLFSGLDWKGVDFVEDDDHARAGDLAQDETFGGLRLHPLAGVDHQKHQVDDLSPANHSPD